MHSDAVKSATILYQFFFHAMKLYTQECNSYLKSKLSNISWYIEYQLGITEFSGSHLFPPSPYFSLLVSFFFSLSPQQHVFLFVRLYASLFVCLSASLFVYLPACLSSLLSLSLKLIFCCKIKIKSLWLMQMNGCFHIQCLNISRSLRY